MAQPLALFEDQHLSLAPALATCPYPFSPVQFLISLYDAAIEACQQRQGAQTRSAVLDLMAALNLPHSRSSSRLFTLFEWCLNRLEARDFQETGEILRVIREAWLTLTDLQHGPACRA